MIAPSSGHEHRYPVDCWRFYPDGFSALGRYTQCEIVDVFADWGNGEWGDAVLVLRKPSWSDDDRERFDHRAGLQRLMLSDEPISAGRIADEWQFQPQSGSVEPSVLADVREGDLTRVLTARRDRRVSTEIEAADLAERERLHELADLRHQVEALTAHADELVKQRDALQEQAASPAKALYGRARAKVADLAGDKGRDTYKRLRGRP